MNVDENNGADYSAVEDGKIFGSSGRFAFSGMANQFYGSTDTVVRLLFFLNPKSIISPCPKSPSRLRNGDGDRSGTSS